MRGSRRLWKSGSQDGGGAICRYQNDTLRTVQYHDIKMRDTLIDKRVKTCITRCTALKVTYFQYRIPLYYI
jgi:hypothetical protein